jgi:hypothetical protein
MAETIDIQRTVTGVLSVMNRLASDRSLRANQRLMKISSAGSYAGFDNAQQEPHEHQGRDVRHHAGERREDPTR